MNLPQHSKSLFTQEVPKVRACFSIKSHELCLIMAASLTDERATQMIDTDFLTLSYQFIFNAAFLKLLENRTYTSFFFSFLMM